MNQETNDAIRVWAEAFQALKPGQHVDDDTLASVVRLERVAREAAAGLPFEIEPSSFFRLLESVAAGAKDDV